jgi:hypothetical protein
MKIHFERSGGFVGSVNWVTVDTSSLPSDEPQLVQNMAEQANFFNLPTKTQSEQNMAL